MIVSETFHLGPYSVRIAVRSDNPAWPCYIVFRGDKYIGKSFSRPDEGCCRWLETQNGVYATPEQSTQLGGYHYKRVAPQRRPGRPRKTDSERELQEALST